MKHLILEEVFHISVKLFYSLFFEDASFKEQFHISKGDKDVEITEWIQQSPLDQQRVCFFTMIENTGKEDVDKTRCLETQRCFLSPSMEDFRVESSLLPENQMGSALFRIDSKWLIQQSGKEKDTSKVTISVDVECKKKIWGVTGMVEGVLEKQASLSYTKWFEMAKNRIISLEGSKAKSSDCSSSEEVVTPVAALPIVSDSSAGFVRMRLSTYKRVVSGTEKLAQMLSSTTLHQLTTNITPSSSFDNTSLDVVIEEHDDSDLKPPDRERLEVKRKKRKGRFLFVIAATLLTVIMWFIMLEE